jgi:hypothetical protein
MVISAIYDQAGQSNTQIPAEDAVRGQKKWEEKNKSKKTQGVKPLARRKILRCLKPEN